MNAAGEVPSEANGNPPMNWAVAEQNLIEATQRNVAAGGRLRCSAPDHPTAER